MSDQGTRESTIGRAAGARGGEVARQLRGIRLIFWAELFCAVFMNVWGGALPVMGGLFGWSMETIDDLFATSTILPPITAIIAARGVFCIVYTGGRPVWRFLLKLGVVLEVLFRLRIAARAIGIELEYPAAFWISRHLLLAAVVCGVFLVCAAKLDTYADPLRPRKLRIAGLALAGAGIVTTFGTGFLRQVVDVDAMFFDTVELAFNGAIGIWALCALWSASTALRLVLDGRCVSCGYRLDRLPTSRCPECGTEFEA